MNFGPHAQWSIFPASRVAGSGPQGEFAVALATGRWEDPTHPQLPVWETLGNRRIRPSSDGCEP